VSSGNLASELASELAGELADEWVYAVPTRLLPAPQPAILAFDRALYDLLRTAGAFYPRQQAENDESLRQIIPYALLQYQGQTLLMRRTQAGSENRLHQRYSLGVGGHINPLDADASQLNPDHDLIEAAFWRELREEVACQVEHRQHLGFLHGDGSAIERVHTGVIYRVVSSTPPVVLEAEKLVGQLASYAEILARQDQLEGWSAALLPCLRQ
jgi:predicted NUDIX family phosphoesterase